MHTIDLEAYFRRIAYTGPREPTLATLKAIHFAHSTTFVFENLNAWTGRRVSLDLKDLEEKFIGSGRGGYCFEANALFAAILRQLGYEVSERVGWVVWMQPPGSRPSRTHMLLQVTIEGRPWIADVGFGSVGQTAPLALDTEEPQETPHETRRYQFNGDIVTHQVRVGPDRWENAYHFDSRPPLPMDFEVGNWFTSTHPDSIFRKSLIVTRPQVDHRLTIGYGELTKRFLDGSSEKRPIADDDDLRNILIHQFGLPADDPAVLEAKLTPGPVFCPGA